jgi:hypothetical protein
MGTVVFVTWIILLVTAVMAMIFMARQAQQLKQSVELRLESWQDSMSRRFHRPRLGMLMTLLPLIPIFITLLRKFKRRA